MSINESKSGEESLSKSLTWVELIILGIGAIIGAGIFTGEAFEAVWYNSLADFAALKLVADSAAAASAAFCAEVVVEPFEFTRFPKAAIADWVEPIDVFTALLKFVYEVALAAA
jgi:hypothetical protein